MADVVRPGRISKLAMSACLALTATLPLASVARAAPPVPAARPACVATTSAIEPKVFGVEMVKPSAAAIAQYGILGIRWARVEIPWNDIESRRGAFNWSGLDRFLALTRAQGIKIDAIIDHKPDWLTSESDYYQRLAIFTSKLVQRYKVDGDLAKSRGWMDYGVRYWEIFNEPNLPGFGWLDRGDNPSEFIGLYANTLTLANATIHRVDPSAVIILGGLSPDGLSPDAFIKGILDLGVVGCFDIFAYHPYGWKGQFTAGAQAIRDILARYRAKKPIWFNEYGTENDDERHPMLAAALSERNAVDGLFWLSMQDWDTGVFGLIDRQNNRREVFKYLQGYLKGATSRF